VINLNGACNLMEKQYKSFPSGKPQGAAEPQPNGSLVPLHVGVRMLGAGRGQLSTVYCSYTQAAASRRLRMTPGSDPGVGSGDL
jgi:hypothetical protein